MTDDERLEYEPIGVIHTPYDSLEGMPIQPSGADATVGTAELKETYAAGLDDLEDFSHCILLYHFHATDGDVSMHVEPFLDETERGLFSTRAPQRPNSIGLSVAVGAGAGTERSVRGIDLVDGTPLLDIKPFVPSPMSLTVTALKPAGWTPPVSASGPSGPTTGFADLRRRLNRTLEAARIRLPAVRAGGVRPRHPGVPT